MKAIHKKITLFVVCLTGFASPFFARGQETVQAWARFDTSGWIGDALELKLVCRSDAPDKVNFPVLQEQISEDLPLLPEDSLRTETVTDAASGLFTRTVSYRFSAYKEGRFAMPAFRFEFVRDDSLRVISTDTGSVRFFAPVVDTLQPIQGIRATFEVSRKELFKEYLDRYGYWIWILPGTAALLLAGLYLWKRYKQGKPVFAPQRPPVPPIDQAIGNLRKLQEKRLWQQGQVKEYYTELTDILRLYLAEGMKIAAVEMTNEELSEALKEHLHGTPEHLRALLSVLDRSVLVKFAKVRPQPDEHEDSLKKVAAFLEYRKSSETEKAHVPSEEQK